jgi:DNA repair exonuclease SbcCD ATPase subunit
MLGAPDRIATLRRRHQQLSANIAHYEARVATQTKELQALNRPSSRSGYDQDADNADDAAAGGAADPDEGIILTKEDLEREEQECAELEKKKRALEERVEGMDKDLGGLMR